MAELFNCERLSARLSRDICAKRHTSKRFLMCQNCRLGAIHAGLIPEPKPSACCARCGRQAERYVDQGLCRSCFNRNSEAIHGKRIKQRLHAVFAKFGDEYQLFIVKDFGELARRLGVPESSIKIIDQ